jgi:hypothetical protein
LQPLRRLKVIIWANDCVVAKTEISAKSRSLVFIVHGFNLLIISF